MFTIKAVGVFLSRPSSSSSSSSSRV